MEDRERSDRPLRDLVEIIHFTENVSAKIHGLRDEGEVYGVVKEEFSKSKRYNASIFLLTDGGSKLRFAVTSLSPERVKAGERVARCRMEEYKIDLNKSNSFRQVVREGKTDEAKIIDVIGELFPKPLAYLVSKIIGYEERSGILTPLKRHGKIIGVLVVDSTTLAEHFIPSVRSLAHHISTALELAEEHAERKRVEAERLKVMGEVARSIGHDLRNPLQVIQNAAYVLRDATGKQKQEMLKMIDRNIAAAESIVQNLRDLPAAPTLKLTEADINGLLEEVIVQTVLPENVKLTDSYGDIPKANVDADQLSRIFRNLILNAVQAMPEGGKLSISTRRDGDFIEIEIRDTGVGISKENLRKIFDPFFTTKAKGMGLGLSNAKRVAEAHRGTITVESEEGRGTTVTIRLPVKQT